MAKEFSKRRADVLRDIRNIINREQNLKFFCEESYYKSGKRDYIMFTVQGDLLDRIRSLYTRPVKRDMEKEISDNIAKKINGRREVICEAGSIDILTDNEIIEVKNYRQWKHAIGQLLVYEKSLKRDYKKVLYLFGRCPEDYLKVITTYCKELHIILCIHKTL